MKKIRLAVIALSWYSKKYSKIVWTNANIKKKLLTHWIEVIFFEETFYSKHCWCPTIESRVNALEHAYDDESINWILVYLWWRNSISLLESIPYDKIKKRNIPLIWYSDITVLLNAIYVKTGVVWIHGPLFLDHWIDNWNTYIETLHELINPVLTTIQYTQKSYYNEDMRWIQWTSQHNTYTIKKWERIKKWKGKWVLVWWNITSFVALCGTEYFPDLTNKVICLEDDEYENLWRIDRAITTLSLQPWFKSIQWIFFWSFHSMTWISLKDIKALIENNTILNNLNIPIVVNIELWHTYPQNYFAIWWKIILNSKENRIQHML